MLQKSNLIRCENLAKSFGPDTAVLRGINLDIFEGECVALIGSNGAGKSTLLKSLIGLHPLTEGSVVTLGEEFNALPTGKQRQKIRRQIGFVFQNHGLVKRLTALSNVVHGMLGMTRGWRAVHQAIAPSEWREAGLSALNAVRLRDKAATRADQLSGGQSQRVAIARALVRNPRLIIADEPAASLDPVAGHEVMKQFSNLTKDNGITLVFTSHDMDHAARYADRIVALKAGKIYFDRPSHKVSKRDLQNVFQD
ncbi:MAG: ATP-binding cassette domain-containing protein [Hyphomicrobiaceae bacterium]|nr:ATP-binding cassette domain-containing protein [Hyphomicrobiaceae bacterium]